MSHIHTLELHQFRLGELDEGDAQRVQEHLDSCEECTGRLSVQSDEREEFEAQATPEAIRRASDPGGSNNRFPKWVWGALAAAAVAMVAVYVTNTDSSAPMEQTRVKGKTAPMEVWIKTTKGSREVRVGEALTQGDEVQVKFRPDGAKWVTVAGRDGSGQLELWGTLEPEGEHLQSTPFGLTLDGQPGPQVFYVLMGENALDIEGVEAALAGNMEGVKVHTLTVPKE